jgi:outer membrane immunogenic protein
MRKIVLAGATAFALVSAPAFAADIPVKAAPMAAPAPAFSWTGFYVGVQGGYGWGRHQFFDETGGSNVYHVTGGVAGGTLGYNLQIGSAVVGIEGDISWADIKGKTGSSPGFGCGPAGAFCASEIKWFGTLRGRLGPAWGQLLPYVTGGVAWAGMEGGFTNLPSNSATKTGWTVGGGLEWAFARNLSAKVEVLHIDGLGRFNVDPNLTCANPAGCSLERSSFNVVRAGVNWRF